MTLWGADFSHYDGPDTRGAVAEGFSFFTHKVGGDARDAEYGTWWGLMKGFDPKMVSLGGYWVLYPGNPKGRADAFLADLDSRSPEWRDRPFTLQADCEIWGGDTSTKPSASEIGAFCDRLVVKAPKLTPIVYAPKWAYGNELRGLDYPLWASRYVSGSGPASSLYPGDSSSYWDAYSGIVPTVLQFSSKATIAGQTTCDANAFRGTLAEFYKIIAPGWESTMASVWDEDKIPNQKWRADYATNPKVTAGFWAGDLWNVAHNAHAEAQKATAAATLAGTKADAVKAAAAELSAKFDALSVKLDTVMTTILAAMGHLPADVASALPTGYQPVSQAMLVDALITVAKEAVGSLPDGPIAPPPAALMADPDVDARTRADREEVQRRIAGE